MSSIIEKTRVAAIYNPQNQSKEELIENFVVRQNTFQRLFKAIKEAKMEVPEQHYLILGRRGMGKTTLLLRLAYEIENDPALNGWLIPLVFNEEEYGIRRLFNFWERIMGLLEQRLPEFRFETAELLRLSAQHKDDETYERILFDWLEKELKRSGKKVILFIDNFGEMTSKLTDEEAHRLRKILQTSPDIRIFAASAVVMEAFYRYDHPFYEFFKVIELKGLDKNETRDLLLKLAQHYKKDAVTQIVEQHPGRVEALRRITGGVIRTIVLLFEIFADDDDGSAFKDLEVVLDRVTPLYKHRMDDLSDQQQAIVEAIALNWDALSVKEITERTRLESKIISAQLQSLEKNGIIQKIPTKTKNNLYIVAERFFNVWYLMRNGRRSDEKRVLWLVRFFEDWCDDDMMKNRAEGHRLALQKGGFDPEAAFTYTQAMAQTQKLSASDRHELLRDTRAFLLENSPDLAKDLMPSELEQAYEGLELWFSGQHKAAIGKIMPLCQRLFEKEMADRIAEGAETEDSSSFWEKGMLDISGQVGYYFSMLKIPDIEKAEQCWLWSANAGNYLAMNNLGVLFINNGRYESKAIEWLEKAANLGSSLAMNNLGVFFQYNKKDFEKAEEWNLKAAMVKDYIAMFNLGLLFKYNKKDLEKAIEWFKASALGGYSEAMFALGLIFEHEKNNISEAMRWHAVAAAAGHSRAMFALGILFEKEKNDLEKAIEWLEKAAEQGEYEALNNLGLIFEKKKKNIKKAIQYNHKAAKLGNLNGMNNLSWRLFSVKRQKSDALQWVVKGLEFDEHNDWIRHTAATVFAWNNRLEESKDLTELFIKNQELLEKATEDVATYFTLMLAKNESKWLLDLFTGPDGEAVQLKDRFKPIYYAILKTLDHPDALRMGEELQQTVDEILAKAKQMAVDYA